MRMPHNGGVRMRFAVPLRFFKRFLAAEAIELDRNHIKRLVLARGFDLTAIGFGNYRSPQSIGSLEGADGEPFVVPSAVSIGWHGAIYGRGLPVRAARLCVKPEADGAAVFSIGWLWVCPSL